MNYKTNIEFWLDRIEESKHESEKIVIYLDNIRDILKDHQKKLIVKNDKDFDSKLKKLAIKLDYLENKDKGVYMKFEVGEEVEFLSESGNYIKGIIDSNGKNNYWFNIKTEFGNISHVHVHFQDIYKEKEAK